MGALGPNDLSWAVRSLATVRSPPSVLGPLSAAHEPHTHRALSMCQPCLSLGNGMVNQLSFNESNEVGVTSKANAHVHAEAVAWTQAALLQIRRSPHKVGGLG